MPKIVQISVPPEKAHIEDYVFHLALQKSGLYDQDIKEWKLKKRSIDARKRPVKIQLAVELFLKGDEITSPIRKVEFKDVSSADPVHIIGAGPAGLFAALACLENGLKPIVYERGKDVRTRRRDLAKLNKEHELNPESNYCYGEGGAGTYSDGKLYTRSTKRGDVNQVLSLLVHHGADAEIMVESHPHIGTNKLPGIITAIRETIIEFGGEVHFDHKMTDLEWGKNTLQRIKINNDQWVKVSNLVLATGHSARDVFQLLQDKNITLEYKPFALGVRVEHPQELINKIQYHGIGFSEYLPPATYSLVEQVEGKGVYSFCMCPGGIIAPCATESTAVVSNGWSPSKRNNPYANSGMVVEVMDELVDAFKSYGPLKGLKFQEKVEQDCWKAAGKTQALPAQRLLDFVNGTLSKDLPKCSYVPGVVSVRLDQILPEPIARRLQKGFLAFGKKLKGFLTNDAIIVAPESRTSSPVRIPRTKTFEHVEVSNLYPCAEGAGYAGGIMSAAIDGIKVIESIKLKKES
ncbi:MAG: NAD(P)/FAD-dependent oxidoreductase [Flavobacteriales bacterium]